MSATRLLVPVLLLCGYTPALAQIDLNPPKAAATISVDVDLVNVLCSVRDKNGSYVKGLQKEDFEVKQDGKRQLLSHFAREVDSPMTVALMLDVSGSVSSIIGVEKSAAARFLGEVLRPGDKSLLVGFAQLIAVWQDLTESKEDMSQALEQAGPGALPSGNPELRPRGGTLLYDAVALVASQKLKRLPGRKTIVVISDGEDNGSIAKISEAVKAAHEADAVLYGIHYVDEERGYSRGGLAALEKLSEPTGGRAFHVSGRVKLEDVFRQIGEEMRNQYGLGFPPPPGAKAGDFHKLEVKTSKAGMKAQARSGYYTGK